MNESGNESLTLALVDPDGRELVTLPLGDVSHFNAQIFLNREVQLYVGTDGHFEVRLVNGDAFATYPYADTPVCDGNEVILDPDGSLNLQWHRLASQPTM